MKLLTKKPQALVLEEGAILEDYRVEVSDDTHFGSELRYLVSGPGGEGALLLMPRHPFADRHERARFRRLAELRTRFTHPAAIEVRDFGEHAGYPFLVTEPHAERTLGDLLEDEAPSSRTGSCGCSARWRTRWTRRTRQGLVHHGSQQRHAPGHARRVAAARLLRAVRAG